MRRKSALATGAWVLALAAVGGDSAAASFDCESARLSKIEATVCEDGALSHMDSQLASVFAIAKATSDANALPALLKAQRDWLTRRNQCATSQCLHTAYETRIAELSSSPTVHGIHFATLFIPPGGSYSPICTEIPIKDLSGLIEAKDIPTAFAAFVPFVPRESKVLDLKCGDIKGDGSQTYILVTRADLGHPGVLTLLARRRDGSLHVEATNDSLIQTDAAGMAGGYEGIALHPRGFTIMNGEGSAGAERSFSFTFRYSRAARTWMLASVVTDTYGRDPVDEEKEEHGHERLTSAKLGQIKFEAFDGIPYGIALP